MKNPAQFVNEVRNETAKVVWPTRKEAAVTSIMVFVMSMIAAMFFFLVDQLIRLGLSGMLGLFG